MAVAPTVHISAAVVSLYRQLTEKFLEAQPAGDQHAHRQHGFESEEDANHRIKHSPKANPNSAGDSFQIHLPVNFRLGLARAAACWPSTPVAAIPNWGAKRFRRRAKVRRIEADFTLADGYQRTPTGATLQNAVRCSGHIDLSCEGSAANFQRCRHFDVLQARFQTNSVSAGVRLLLRT